MCCTWLAGNAGPKKSPKNHHLGTIAQLCRAMSLRLRHVSTIGKKLVKQQYLPTCLHNVVNFGPLTAEILSGVWGTPANLNGFRVLAALLHSHNQVTSLTHPFMIQWLPRKEISFLLCRISESRKTPKFTWKTAAQKSSQRKSPNDTYILSEHVWEHAMNHMKCKHEPISLEQWSTSVSEDRVLQQCTQGLDTMFCAGALLQNTYNKDAASSNKCKRKSVTLKWFFTSVVKTELDYKT